MPSLTKEQKLDKEAESIVYDALIKVHQLFMANGDNDNAAECKTIAAVKKAEEGFMK